MKVLQWIYMILSFMYIPAWSYEKGDRLSSLVQTSHREWETPWMEIPIQNMPRFGIFDSSIVRVHLPHEERNGNSPEISIDVKEDVRVGFTFATNKLVIPKIVLFDSKERKSIDKLIITFYHDQYDVLDIKYEIKYGSRIKRLDPTHPSLTAFEIRYNWESVQEVDFPLAITVMFSSSIVILFAIGAMVWNFHPRDVKYFVTSDNKPSVNGQSSVVKSSVMHQQDSGPRLR